MLIQEKKFLVMVRDEHSYVFVYDDESKPEVLRQLGRFAASSDLTFSWHDAVILARRMREGV